MQTSASGDHTGGKLSTEAIALASQCCSGGIQVTMGAERKVSDLLAQLPGTYIHPAWPCKPRGQHPPSFTLTPPQPSIGVTEQMIVEKMPLVREVRESLSGGVVAVQNLLAQPQTVARILQRRCQTSKQGNYRIHPHAHSGGKEIPSLQGNFLPVCSFVVSSRPLPCREAVQAAFRKPGTHHTPQDPAFRGITTIPVIGKQHKWV